MKVEETPRRVTLACVFLIFAVSALRKTRQSEEKTAGFEVVGRIMPTTANMLAPPKLQSSRVVHRADIQLYWIRVDGSDMWW